MSPTEPEHNQSFLARVEAQQFVSQIGYDVADICTSAFELSFRTGSFVHNEKRLLEKQHNEHLSP